MASLEKMAKALDVNLVEGLTCLPAKVGSVMTIGGWGGQLQEGSTFSSHFYWLASGHDINILRY